MAPPVVIIAAAFSALVAAGAVAQTTATASAPAAPVAAAPAAAPAFITQNVAWTDVTPQVAGALPYNPISAGAILPAAALAAYPDMPSTTGGLAWPDSNEQKGVINLPALLSSPLVANALALVNKTVDQTFLAIPQSLRVDNSGKTQYAMGDLGVAAANCWWPSSNCVSPTQTNFAYLKPDVASCPGANVLGLNYDDGPSTTVQNNGTSTQDLAAQLASMNQKATFFATGSNSYMNPQALKDLYNAGHEIAVHSWSHAPMTSLTTEQIVAEIKYTEAIIYAIIGRRPRYFRAPYGDIDNRVRAIAGALGYESVLWGHDKDTGDSDGGTLASVVTAFTSWNLPNQPGFIDLEHSLNIQSNDYAIAALKAAQTAQAAGTWTLTMMPVGQCQGKTSYVDLTGAALPNLPAASTPAAAAQTTSLGAAVPTPVVAGSTVGSKPASPTPSGSAQDIPHSAAGSQACAGAGAVGALAVLAAVSHLL
ncbi:chitin deacetylase [Geranomyces variabilis]|uniref:Chitin deacetylase n=1 Tax=Geranomyces variabilis TaxID=109894 RepID=A0AAD5XUX5_9FUNG|nr:chitin deacetylase [Geranomyces variabilis]